MRGAHQLRAHRLWCFDQPDNPSLPRHQPCDLRQAVAAFWAPLPDKVLLRCGLTRQNDQPVRRKKTNDAGSSKNGVIHLVPRLA